MTLSRRDFLGTLSASTGIGSLAARAKEPRPMLPVIDTHIHLWDLKKFRLPWLGPTSRLCRDHLVSDYEKATEGVPLVKGVYMEVDVAEDQKQAEADWIRALCAAGQSKVVAAVVGARVADPGFEKYATAFKGDKFIKGVRQVLHGGATPRGTCLKEAFVTGIRLLGQLGLSFDLCMRASELKDAAELASRCGDTRFILDHCGNPNTRSKDLTDWKRDLEAVAKQRNVHCKVSGLFSSSKTGWKPELFAPVIHHVLDTFGPDRVLFAADWPVCTSGGTWKQWYEVVLEVTQERKAEERKKLFHDNAAKFYGI